MATISARSLATQLTGWRDAASGPAYQSLADRVRLLILDGRVPLGTRLPAERELASQLGLSRTTVSSAYSELRDAGYLDSIRGSGSLSRLPSPHDAPEPEPGSDMLDFSKATLPAIPGVLAAAERAIQQLPAYLGESGFDAFGLRTLRQAIADRFTARGLPTHSDEVLVTIGAQHAISLVARTVLARGDRALVESPSYPHAFEALRAAGGRLVPVAVTTDDGWDDSGLEQGIQRTSPSLAYLMPDFHNPTGRVMPLEQRERVMALAARQGTTLVIDETMAELGMDGQTPMPPFGTHGTVVTVGSVGKSVWGGLRIGWIRASREFIQRAGRVRFGGDLGTPIIDQLTVAALMPDMDDILAARGLLLRTGRDHLAGLLAEHLPEWEMPHVPGGLTAWIGLGAPLSSQLAIAARDEGLIIAAGPRFGLEGVFERHLRIPFSHPLEHTDRAVEALTRAWARVSRQTVSLGAADFAQVV